MNILNILKTEQNICTNYKIQIYIWATTQQNLSSGVSDQARHKPACAATEARAPDNFSGNWVFHSLKFY